MGARAVELVRPRRPRWRAYLLLARVSNVPTIWSNVLAGTLAAAAVVEPGRWLQVAAAASLFYIGGMFLNDAFDAEIDARERPERPLPAGDVPRAEAFAVGGAMLATGLALLPLNALLYGALLVAAIVFYDYRHKGDRLAPLVMGVCRGLVYVVAAAASGAINPPVIAAALVLTFYVLALTVVARFAGHRARWLVPLLIAGISLVDAAVILLTAGAPELAACAALGFPATLLLQRVVPGD
jgi:4-hydroxybenzoate polyprenyltransferase